MKESISEFVKKKRFRNKKIIRNDNFYQFLYQLIQELIYSRITLYFL